MGKFISRYRGQDEEESKSRNNLLKDDEKRYDPSEQTSKPTDENIFRRKYIGNVEEPVEGWEEICCIGTDVLQDVMADKKHKVVQTGRRLFKEKIDIPTTEENRIRLKKAYELWIKYRKEDCLALPPCRERILERPLMEQSYLVEEYVRKIFRLLELEDLPVYDIPEDIPKEEVLIRDPNMPGVFITLAEALEKQKRKRKIDVGDLKSEDWSIDNFSFSKK